MTYSVDQALQCKGEVTGQHRRPNAAGALAQKQQRPGDWRSAGKAVTAFSCERNETSAAAFRLGVLMPRPSGRGSTNRRRVLNVGIRIA